jgi:hypothetical protein
MELKTETYSVWVGGGEINDYLLTKEQAEKLAQEWRDDGYEEVAITNYESELKTEVYCGDCLTPINECHHGKEMK